MDPIEYIVLGMIYEAALDASTRFEATEDLSRDDRNTYLMIRDVRLPIADELIHTPAPHGWRCEIPSCSYRTWSVS